MTKQDGKGRDMADERQVENMKDCFGVGMLWWVPVKEGVTNPEKQKECYTCVDFEMCGRAHLAHSIRHLGEISLHYVKSQAASGGS